jgi:hypothetical protein
MKYCWITSDNDDTIKLTAKEIRALLDFATKAMDDGFGGDHKEGQSAVQKIEKLIGEE